MDVEAATLPISLGGEVRGQFSIYPGRHVLDYTTPSWQPASTPNGPGIDGYVILVRLYSTWRRRAKFTYLGDGERQRSGYDASSSASVGAPSSLSGASELSSMLWRSAMEIIKGSYHTEGVRKIRFHGTRPIQSSTGRTTHLRTCAGARPRHCPERLRSTTAQLNVTSTPCRRRDCRVSIAMGPKFAISLCAEHAKLFGVRMASESSAKSSYYVAKEQEQEHGAMGRNIPWK
jgi:hypothetical protein